MASRAGPDPPEAAVISTNVAAGDDRPDTVVTGPAPVLGDRCGPCQRRSYTADVINPVAAALTEPTEPYPCPIGAGWHLRPVGPPLSRDHSSPDRA